jgi:hypothetical protein
MYVCTFCARISHYGVFILCCHLRIVIVICSTSNDLRNIMIQAYQIGMTTNGYVYITSPSDVYGMGTRNSQFIRNDNLDTIAEAAFSYVFYVRLVTA